MIGRYADQMTFEYIMARMLERVPNTIDKREGSVIYDALAPAAAELTKAYIELDVVMDETFVDTASMQYLILRCKERGVKIEGETAAVIKGAFEPETIELRAGTRFNFDQINYVVTEKIADGYYRLQAETLGTAGNKYSGTLLPIENISGLERAEIVDLIVPGEDGDTTDTLREKYYKSIQGEAFGGNIADYKERVNAIAGVGGVKVKRAPQGGGTVQLTIISSDYHVPSAELIEDVQEKIDPIDKQGEGLGIAPIDHIVTVVGVGAQPVDVQTNITFISGWNFADGKAQIEQTIKDYFAELAAEWENAIASIVRIAQIETRLLNLPFVLDIADTMLNGSAKNLQIDADKIPVLGGVSNG